jgi:hypothetical protein
MGASQLVVGHDVAPTEDAQMVHNVALDTGVLDKMG